MTLTLIALGLTLATPSTASDNHGHNALYLAVREEGLSAGDVKVKLPAPTLRDGVSADTEQEALKQIAGSGRGVGDLTRDSVTAPVVIKTRDERAGELGTVRVADVWFVVHAKLEDLRPALSAAPQEKGETIEAGNMRFTTAPVDSKTLDGLGLKPAESEHRWYVRMSGRLLDRLQFEATDGIVVSEAASSWVIAARTDPKFGEANRWFPVDRKTGREETEKAERYPGGISYVKVTRLETVPGAVLVEGHFAFFEPKAWFDGAPILRSKIGLVVQDRVRALRRDLAKSQKGNSRRTKPGPNGG